MKKEEIISVTQIRIKLKDKEISLSSDEARKVYLELSKLFELEKGDFQEEYEKINPNLPNKEYIPYPIYIERWPASPPWKQWEIWGETTTKPIWETTCNTESNLRNKYYLGDSPDSIGDGKQSFDGQILSINLS